jgi:peroxiredoxin
MKAIWMLLLPLCLFAGCVVDSEENSSDSEDRIKVGDRLPSFSVDVIDGDSTYVFSSGSLTGRTVIVFFNTSCKDCQRELPELNDYYLRHRDEPGFQMVAIAREESASEISAYWQEHGLSIPYSPQDNRRVYALFADQTIPRVYICSDLGLVEWIGIENFELVEKK